MPTPPFPRPEDAENAFYEALEKGDLEAMMALWADDDDVTCIHPGGQRLCGHTQIRNGWQNIFAATQRFSVQVSERVCWQGGMLAVHSLVENVFAEGDPEPRGPILVTNVFVRGSDGWRLLAHHASPGPDEGNAETMGDGPPRVLH